jgi:hypothetical protein
MDAFAGKWIGRILQKMAAPDCSKLVALFNAANVQGAQPGLAARTITITGDLTRWTP